MSNTNLNGIAIVGMAGRFPKANSVDAFWKNLCAGEEGISFFSAEELAEAGVTLPNRNQAYVKARGILDQAEWFDAAFFSITPREAEIMDPQHRVFLECAWEALENAGYDPQRFDGAIGVFAGMSMNTYLVNNLLANPELMAQVGEYQAMLGNDKDFLPTRVSYKLNLRGPSVNIQTACSTSLVAVCVACQNLLNFDCDMALAGAVSISFPQKRGYVYQEGGIASPDGHCRPFDAKAAGTLPGEGTAIVVLKRLEDALQDRDTIYAVIKGFALNNDGSNKIGYTAPGVEGQAEAITTAQAMADFSPETIGYVEAHGTATPLGDPIEIEGLTKAFRNGTAGKNFCAIGSVKSNIGHLDTAAGVAGLIKTALALHHKMIPASLHFEAPNPKIDFDTTPFYVNDKLSPWPDGRTPRRAGVSSFGIGGTNAHVVLEEASRPLRSEAKTAANSPQILLLSAKSHTALNQAASNLAEYLAQHPELTLEDVAYTLQLGRRHFGERLFCVANHLPQAVVRLKGTETNLAGRGTAQEKPVVCFMFPGQGSQQIQMASELYQREAIFQKHVNACSEILRPHLGLDLRTVLYPDLTNAKQATEQLTQTRLAQPALFVIEYALARLWMDWGVQPHGLIGHSLGEYVAACVSGVLSLEDALRLVATRGALMQQMPAGRMLAVRLPEAELKPFLSEHLSLAAVNAPSLCVVSGPAEIVEQLQNQLAQKEIACTPLHTSHAFHSKMMESVVEPFSKLLNSVQWNAPKIPFISNVTGDWITVEQAQDPAYWTRHLRQTVRFADGLEQLRKLPNCVLLEVGPGQTLTSLARQHPARRGPAISSLRRANAQASDIETLLVGLGQLWTAGVELDWAAVHNHGTRQRVPLPTYPFERKRFWIEPTRTRAESYQSAVRAEVSSPAFPNGEHRAETSSGSVPPAVVSMSQDRAPANRKEVLVEQLRALLAQLSGLNLSDVAATATFTEIGFESLFLTQAALVIEKKFGIRIAFRQLLEEANSLEGVANLLDAQLAPEAARHQPESLSRSANRTSETKLAANGNGSLDESRSARVPLRKPSTGDASQSHRPFKSLSKYLPWLQATETTLSTTNPVTPISSYPGLEQELNDLCCAYICNYFASCHIEARSGKRHTYAELRRALNLRPSYERFFKYFLQILSEDKVVRLEGEDLIWLRSADELPAPAVLRASIEQRFPGFQGLLDMLEHCVSHYRAALSGDILGVSVLLPEGRHDFLRERLQPYADAHKQVRIYEHLTTELVLRLNQEKPLRILEVGAGGGDLTWKLVRRLKQCQYHFTDISKTFVAAAEKEAARRGIDFMSFGALDISRDPLKQQLDAESFDLVLALNVVHATPDVGDTIAHLKKLLAPAGLICLVELTRYWRWDNMIIGLADGWWLYNDRYRSQSPLLPVAGWEQVFRDQGLSVMALPVNPTARATGDAGLVIAQGEQKIPTPARQLSAAAEKALPLTPAQTELWMACQIDPGASCAYNDSRLLRLTGDLRTDLLSQALQRLVDRHEALRTTFSSEGDRQFVLPRLEIEIARVDLSGEDSAAQALRLEEFERTEATSPFDLVRGPLVRGRLVKLGPNAHLLLLTIHHIVCDGHSWGILATELGQIYSELLSGSPALLPEPLQLSQFVQEQQSDSVNRERDCSEKFWTEKFSIPAPPLDLPTDSPRPRSWKFGGGRQVSRVESKLCQQLKRLSENQNTTLFTTLLAANYLMLSRLTGQRDIVIGIPAAERSTERSNTLVAHSVNFLPLRVGIPEAVTFAQFLARVKTGFLEAHEHRACTLGTLIQKLNLQRDAGRIPLASVTFNLDRLRHGLRFEGLQADLRLNSYSFSNFDLSLNVTEIDGELHCDCRYLTALFSAATIRRWLQHFTTLLSRIVERPNTPVHELSIMTEQERKQLVEDFNQTTTAYERDACVHHLFEAQCRNNPDAIAVVFGEQQLTYAELNHRANQLALDLQGLGVGVGTPVGICLERSPEFIVATLAVLKAGGVYVPLDRTYPTARLQFMLKDSAAPVLLTDCELDAPDSCQKVRLDQRAESTSPRSVEHVAANLTANHLAYVMYTSGSTGNPKGTCIPHRAIVRLVRATNYAEFSRSDVFLQLAPTSFDASTFEIWGCLLNGAKLVIPPPGLLTLEQLGSTIAQQKVTTLWLTAGLFHQMVDEQIETLKGVRQLLAGGDVLSPSHVLKALQELPATQLINGYGPTENTTFTCCYRIPRDWRGEGSVPIGKPISNTRVYVLDAVLQPTPIGVEGELFVGGDGLAKGYLNQPELDAEKFLPNPFDSNTRLYRTGDRVRWREDGTLEFLGRFDQQVKIRGYRVESGEIEAVLGRHPGIQQAVAMVQPEKPQERLVAYLVPVPGSQRPTSTDLRRFLETTLPEFMIPQAYVFVDALPLTANGKVDRRALPAVSAERPELAEQFVPSTTPTQTTLTGIWREVLRLERIGVNDDFFELGGHSLLIMQVISRVRQAFQVELPMTRFFEKPTIAALAESIDSAAGKQVEGTPIIRTQRARAKDLLNRLDQLSDNEVDELLQDPQFKNLT